MLEIIQRLPNMHVSPVPLLFVHGILHGAWCYDEYMLPYMARHGYHACAVSLRGHGGSSLNGSLRWVRVADYVQDVRIASEQIARETGSAPILIGHSMGGLVVQKFLERYTAPAAVLLASVPVGGGLQAVLKTLLRWPLPMLASPVSFQPFLSNPAALRWAMFRDDMPAEQAERYCRRLGNESFRAILDLALLNTPRPSRVKPVPMLVINGSADRLFSDADGQRTAAAYQAEYVLIGGAAHDMMVDATWQQTADHLLDWLRRQTR